MIGNVALYKQKDFGNINAVSLILGRNCNLFCRHCYQMPVKVNDVLDYHISDKVLELLINYAKYSSTLAPNGNPLNQIVFWGGEPLLYWDIIKKLVLYFEKNNIYSGQQVSFSITTNGKALTNDIVSFINEHNLMVGFSYEAPYPFAVRGYISDKVCELANKINNLIIHANCATKYNCDSLLAYYCLREKFPNAKEYHIFERLTCSFFIPEDILDYDWDAIRMNFKKLRIAAQLGEEFAYMKLFDYVKNISFMISEKSSDLFGLRILRCMKCDMEFAVTLDGKMFCCNNGCYFPNSVEDKWEDIVNYHLDYAKKIASSYCEQCRHHDICWKQCALNVKDSDGIYLVCKKFLIPFYDIVKKEIKNLSKPLSDSDVRWFREQEKIMKYQVQEFLQEENRYKDKMI